MIEMIYWQLFWSFVQVGVVCVGGGYAAMPLIEAQVVDLHGWACSFLGVLCWWFCMWNGGVNPKKMAV